MGQLTNTLRAGYRFVRGGGEPSLLRRKEYHARRAEAERAVLQEAKSRPKMFREVVCPACGRPESSAQFRNPVGFSFAVCRHDGTVYMNPAPTLETLSRLYNDDSYSDFWSVGHAIEPADYQRVDQFVPRAGQQSLLDVGCSTGEFLKLARQRFACYGVEINRETAELAQASGFDVVTGTVADVPGSERFDVVTMLQVIEHLVEPREVLPAIHRLLKPGGILYLNTPCVDSASFALFRERHMHVSSFGHVSLFTKPGLASLAERSQFALMAHGYCGDSDIKLHDLLTRRFAPNRFVHRVALYSPRILNGCTFLDAITFGQLTKALSPQGNASYQWAVFRKA